MIWIGNNLYDPEAKLYDHGYNPASGQGNGHFWSRAIGCYAAALADVISMLPDSYSSQKASLIAIEKQLFDGMMEYQDADTGRFMVPGTECGTGRKDADRAEWFFAVSPVYVFRNIRR